jgi:hypothetical protein
MERKHRAPRPADLLQPPQSPCVCKKTGSPIDYIGDRTPLSGYVDMTDWSQVVQEHGPLVWRTAYRLLGNEADAADCFQRAFVFRITTLGDRKENEWLQASQPSVLHALGVSQELSQPVPDQQSVLPLLAVVRQQFSSPLRGQPGTAPKSMASSSSQA